MSDIIFPNIHCITVVCNSLPMPSVIVGTMYSLVKQ